MCRASMKSKAAGGMAQAAGGELSDADMTIPGAGDDVHISG